MSDKFVISRFLIDMVMSLMNCSSSLLFLIIDLFLELTFFSTIGIVIVRGTWSEVRHHLRWIKWLSSSVELHWRNIRSMTEFESFALSEYLVGIWLMGIDKFKLKELAIIRRLSLMDEWWGNEESYKLSQMLKSPVIIRRFWMFTSVFLRYFKIECEELE